MPGLDDIGRRIRETFAQAEADMGRQLRAVFAQAEPPTPRRLTVLPTSSDAQVVQHGTEPGQEMCWRCTATPVPDHRADLGVCDACHADLSADAGRNRTDVRALSVDGFFCDEEPSVFASLDEARAALAGRVAGDPPQMDIGDALALVQRRLREMTAPWERACRARHPLAPVRCVLGDDHLGPHFSWSGNFTDPDSPAYLTYWSDAAARQWALRTTHQETTGGDAS